MRYKSMWGRLMKADEVIERLCKLQTEVSDVLGYDHPADCFCNKGGFKNAGRESYRNDGVSLEFIEAATRAALAARPGSTR